MNVDVKVEEHVVVVFTIVAVYVLNLSIKSKGIICFQKNKIKVEKFIILLYLAIRGEKKL